MGERPGKSQTKDHWEYKNLTKQQSNENKGLAIRKLIVTLATGNFSKDVQIERKSNRMVSECKEDRKK